MNSFIDNISLLTGLNFDTLFGAYKVINFSNKAVYIEGAFRLISVERAEIKIKLKKGILLVEGNELTLRDIQKGSAVITGNITHFEIN